MPVEYIDLSGIQSKLEAVASKSSTATRMAMSGLSEGASDIAYELGEKCARCIEDALSGSGASGNMIAAVGDVWAGSPSKVSDTEYQVDIFIDENTRPSLNPNDALKDMAALVNKGYDHVEHRVRGKWHGKEILNMPSLSGTNFVQQGISDFNGNYGSGYIDGVTASAELDGNRFNS